MKPTIREKHPFKRHPAAIAWDAWLASEEGKQGTEPTTLNAPEMMRHFLENRLSRAYAAGWRDAEKSAKADPNSSR